MNTTTTVTKSPARRASTRTTRQSAVRTVANGMVVKYEGTAEVEAMDDTMPQEDATPPPATPSPRKRKRAAVIEKSAQSMDPPAPSLATGNADGSDSDLTPAEDEKASPTKKGAKKRSPRKKRATKDLGESGVGDDEGEVNAKKPRKKREPKPEPVYVIPDVEKKETTFKGRLGYACLNTILRNKKPAAESIFCSRTCRIDSIKKNGLDWVKELGRQNIRDLAKLLEWNEENHIKFMRMSSEMFPFASHPIYGYSLEYCEDDLKAVGDLANRLGHRLTTHPGQFTQLGSLKTEVVRNAGRDLAYHCEMMDRMGLGKDSVMIIHGGGVYGDKPAALERIKKSFMELPQNVRDRLVLENDEMCYNADDLLPLCDELNIPLVFDYHHDWIYPSSIPPAEIIQRANVIWARRGIKPKQHLSEPRPGAETVMQKRAHADRCQALPVDLPDDMDLMIEAKDKEQAVLHLYRIYGLQPVIHANLRPPAEEQTTETKGRKSAKTGRKKAADSGLVDEEDELKGEDPHVPIEDDQQEEASPRRLRLQRRAALRKTDSYREAQVDEDDAEIEQSDNDGSFKGDIAEGVEEEEDDDTYDEQPKASPRKKARKERGTVGA